MISWEAHAWHVECWWHRCHLPGALQACETSDGEMQVRLCGLHREVLSVLLPHPQLAVQLWHEDPSGVPVLLAVRAPA